MHGKYNVNPYIYYTYILHMFRQVFILGGSGSCIPLWWNPWRWHLVVETYVRVFNIHYICILSSAFVGCYEDEYKNFVGIKFAYLNQG
jgi:hypothetical protein